MVTGPSHAKAGDAAEKLRIKNVYTRICGMSHYYAVVTPSIEARQCQVDTRRYCEGAVDTTKWSFQVLFMRSLGPDLWILSGQRSADL